MHVRSDCKMVSWLRNATCFVFFLSFFCAFGAFTTNRFRSYAMMMPNLTAVNWRGKTVSIPYQANAWPTGYKTLIFYAIIFDTCIPSYGHCKSINLISCNVGKTCIYWLSAQPLGCCDWREVCSVLLCIERRWCRWLHVRISFWTKMTYNIFDPF